MAPNDLTPCRMAFYFVSTFAIAQTPTKQPALRLSRTKNLHFAKAPFPGFSATAQVLQYLYQHRTNDGAEIVANASKLGNQLQIDRTTVSRSIIRLAKWGVLQRYSEPGRPLTVILNEEVISEALEVSRKSLLSNQQRVGFLTWH